MDQTELWFCVSGRGYIPEYGNGYYAGEGTGDGFDYSTGEGAETGESAIIGSGTFY